MASTFSLSGGRPRCFAYWQEFSKCYAGSDNPKECKLQADDYLECLHHTKEIARAKAVATEFKRKANQAAREGRKLADILSEGATAGVGLIQKGGSESGHSD